jgi:hypothetical protein
MKPFWALRPKTNGILYKQILQYTAESPTIFVTTVTGHSEELAGCGFSTLNYTLVSNC